MVRLWNSTETNFKGNKWVLTECIKCEVTEELNGEFALDLEYPLQDSKNLSKYLLRGNIITCPVADSRAEQQFRIRKVEKTASRVIVYAQAKLIADLKENRIKATTLTGLTRKQAIQKVIDLSLESTNYKVGTLDSSTSTNYIVNLLEMSTLEGIIGTENSVLSEYGGEFIINNNNIDIVNKRGTDNGFTIAYAKNISSIKETIDDTDLSTVLIPKSGDYRLPEYLIESPLVGSYEKRYFKEVDMNLSIWNGEGEKGEDQITLDEAYALMRSTCNLMFSKDGVDKVNFNYSVDLVTLRKTEEYKNYNILEKCYLGDTIKVKHKLLNVDLVGRVNKTVYNVLLDKYSSVEIGFKKKDITDIINTTVKQIQFAKEEIKLELKNNISRVNVQLKLADDKMNAVVEKDGTGMGWQLKQDAFVVACQGASGASVTIDKNGQTIDDGKFRIKKNGDTVFKVNTSGVCNAVGGFIVEDDSTSCEIGSEGVTLTGENGKVAKIQILDDGTYSGTYIRDDLYVEDVLRVFGMAKFEKGAVFMEDDITIGDETLEEYIIRIIGENT